MEVKPCQYCCSEIPVAAQKCRYCQEWQEGTNEPGIEEIVLEEDPVEEHLEVPEPFQLRMTKFIPVESYVSRVLIFCAAIFIIIYFLWINLDEDWEFLISFGFYTLQMSISWAGLIWVYYLITNSFPSFVKISSKNPDVTKNYFVGKMKLIFHVRNSILAGIVFGLIAAIGDYLVGTKFNGPKAEWIFAAFEFTNMFFAGAAIYSILMFAIFLQQFSSAASKEKYFKNISHGANDIGQVHIKTSVLAIVPLFIGVIARLFGTWEWHPLIIVWYVAVAVLIIIYIFWPVIHVHRLLLREKNIQLSIIQKRIDELVLIVGTTPTSRNFNRLYRLREIEKSTDRLNTWPFDAKSIWAAFIAVIIPLGLMIIEYYMISQEV